MPPWVCIIIDYTSPSSESVNRPLTLQRPKNEKNGNTDIKMNKSKNKDKNKNKNRNNNNKNEIPVLAHVNSRRRQ
jgi:hypothetical protein